MRALLPPARAWRDTYRAFDLYIAERIAVQTLLRMPLP